MQTLNNRLKKEEPAGITSAGIGMKKYIMKGPLPLRLLLYCKIVIKVCSECEKIMNAGDGQYIRIREKRADLSTEYLV